MASFGEGGEKREARADARALFLFWVALDGLETQGYQPSPFKATASANTTADSCGMENQGAGSLLQQRSVFVWCLGFVGGDYHGGGYLVVGVEVEELYAHGGAAGGADGFGVDADDLAELRDDHHLRGVVD